MLIILAVGIGALISVMVSLNGGLQSILGPIAALTIIHIAGLAASFSFTPLLGGLPPRKRRRPARILLMAGALGLPIVYLNNRVFLEGGVLLTLSGMLAGQSVAAALFESSPWSSVRAGSPLQRLIPLSFILPGSLAIAISAEVGIGWLLISWMPGGFLMLQLMMNSRLGSAIGQDRMLRWNYLSGLTPPLLLILLQWGRFAPDLLRFSEVPLHLLIGGGVIGVAVIAGQSRLLTRMQALTMVLATYLGQFGMGIALDLLSGRPAGWMYLAGSLLVFLGLLAGEGIRRR